MSESHVIDISRKDPAAVLVALYNASKPLGMGILQFTPGNMSLEEARHLLAQSRYFDYLHGRVMKVTIEGPTLNPWLYDRDNGQGAAARAIANVPDMKN